MSRRVSALQQARRAYEPRRPAILAEGLGAVTLTAGAATRAVRDVDAIAERFPGTFGRAVLEFEAGSGPPDPKPHNVGVVLSGGQAPGGHNVITGLFDALCDLGAGSRLLGFRGGPRGILERSYRELDATLLDDYRNTGGFDLIGSGRDKIETERQFADCRKTCESLALDGLVVIGGDDSNTNAALLAEDFLAHGLSTVVAGVPKTIDGDMKGGGIETSFGFDTATKVYAELVGNICRDAASAGKYWHFVKLMGRSASHVALECGLQVQPNVTLVAEEIQRDGLTLEAIARNVADVIRTRREAGRSHGVCLVPEGLIEFVPEMKRLIAELNEILHRSEDAGEPPSVEERLVRVTQALGAENRTVMEDLPRRIQEQLLLDRDSHGNVQVSKIDTEALLVELVRRRLEAERRAGRYEGKFQVQHHFFGYEGRCAAPSNFDADYAYGLGQVAAALVVFRRTGYICGLRGLGGPPSSWRPAGIPLTSLMQLEMRKGRATPVIGKALVDLDGEPFRRLARHRRTWEVEDHYVYPGAIQYYGPPEVADRASITILLEQGGPKE